MICAIAEENLFSVAQIQSTDMIIVEIPHSVCPLAHVISRFLIGVYILGVKPLKKLQTSYRTLSGVITMF